MEGMLEALNNSQLRKFKAAAQHLEPMFKVGKAGLSEGFVRSVDTALSAVLIGRTVGGNLPRVLETTAGSLREMQRLEGVIRSKTADGRMQLYVIGAMPAVLVVLMNVVWPGYFNPLTDNIIGYVIVVGVVIMWASAIVVARKVLAVDI